MKITCPHCGVAMMAPDHLTGNTDVECCDCHKIFTHSFAVGDGDRYDVIVDSLTRRASYGMPLCFVFAATGVLLLFLQESSASLILPFSLIFMGLFFLLLGDFLLILCVIACRLKNSNKNK